MKTIVIIKELFRNTSKLVRYNIILVQPLLIFFFILTLLLSPVFSSGKNILYSPAGFIMIISIAGLICAFMAGWFSMFHKSMELLSKPAPTREERASHSINLFKEFFPGVGKHFTNIVLGIVFGLILYFIIVALTLIIGKGTGMTHGISLISHDNIKKIMDSFDDSQLTRLHSKITLIAIIIRFLFLYLTMFWMQAIISEDKNPITAYIESIKTVLKNPVATLTIFLSNFGCLFVLCFILSFLNTTKFNSESFLGFIIQFSGQVFLFMIIIYFTMMNFLYFEKYSKKNISISRPHSVRQN